MITQTSPNVPLIELGLSIMVRALFKLFFITAAPLISKFFLAHLSSGGQMENFVYKQTKMNREKEVYVRLKRNKI